jgi:hypothetical protein
MKTYEGTFIVKWHKNSNGSRRAITIDCNDKQELNKQLKRIKNNFMTKGDDPLVAAIYGTHDKVGVPAHSVKFDIHERK